MSNNIFTGTIPALMTPCTAERTLDYDALVAKGRELVDLGMSAVVYCGSMGFVAVRRDGRANAIVMYCL